MRTPIRPVPDFVARWKFRARVLRTLDVIAAWVILCLVVAQVISAPRGDLALIALVVVCACGVIAPLRTRWRPLSALVGVVVSRRLRPGIRAWYITGRQAEQVLVTGRHRLRVVIALPAHGAEEALTVRRTRVLLLPAEA